MFSTLVLLCLAGWTNPSADREDAAAIAAQALEAGVHAELPVDDLVHLRVTLATAYLEAGRYRDMEAVLQAAKKSASGIVTAVPRAELLNAWSALHLKMGRISQAEAELQEAARVVSGLPGAGSLPATLLHNLAAVELRTGRYGEALQHEQEALRWFEKSPDHAASIRAWASLASIQYMMGHPADARLSIERALTSAEVTYGPAHPIMADLLESDAVVLDKLKLKRSAGQARDRARRIRGNRTPTGDDQIRSMKEVTTSTDRVYLRSR